VVPDVAAPVVVTGNAITLIGDPASTGSTSGSAPAGWSGSGSTTSGSDGILGGTQILGGVGLPIAVTGNSVTLIGDPASTGSTSGSAPAGSSGSGSTTTGADGVAGGTQVVPDVVAPVAVTGNAITLIGDPASTGSTSGSAPAGSSGSGSTTSGSDGILGGTQVVPDVAAPVVVTGNAITLIGDPASSGSTSGSTAGTAPAGSGSTTSGTGGILGGTQILGGVALPITVTGNSVTVVGDPTTGGVTPTGPTAPTTPTTPGTPAVPSGSTGLGNVALADTSSAVLASTGADPTVAGVIGLLTLMVGLGLAFVARRRAAAL
jgi:hypothetical protein